jgi:hypothetical protein
MDRVSRRDENPQPGACGHEIGSDVRHLVLRPGTVEDEDAVRLPDGLDEAPTTVGPGAHDLAQPRGLLRSRNRLPSAPELVVFEGQPEDRRVLGCLECVRHLQCEPCLADALDPGDRDQAVVLGAEHRRQRRQLLLPADERAAHGRLGCPRQEAGRMVVRQPVHLGGAETKGVGEKAQGVRPGLPYLPVLQIAYRSNAESAGARQLLLGQSDL